MVRWIRKWLVLILACLMLACITIALVSLSRREKACAEADLTQLINRGFDEVSEGAAYADPVVKAEQESLLSKAHAVVRFLAHDDSLLATDALDALCEQLSVDRIDVADVDGELIASSEADRIGLALGSESEFEWTMAAADDAEAAITQADETDRSLIYACVGRTDIEGFVLLSRDDPFVDEALAKSQTDELLSALTYGDDIIFEAQAGSEDGSFYDAGSLCVRKTENGVSLIAARAESEVFRGRNAALMALGTAALCILICGVAAYLLRLEPVVALEEREPSAEDDTHLLQTTDDSERYDEPDRAEETEAEGAETNAEAAEPEAQEPAHPKKRARRKKRTEPPAGENDGEDPFDHILD